VSRQLQTWPLRLQLRQANFGISLQPDAKLGGTEIFVSADRYYPAGFRVEIGAGLVMAFKPSDRKLQVVSSVKESDRRQAGLVRWDDEKLHLIIGKWVEPTPRLAIKIAPVPDSKP
jgi:endoglycosylceramidase